MDSYHGIYFLSHHFSKSDITIVQIVINYITIKKNYGIDWISFQTFDINPSKYIIKFMTFRRIVER